MDGESQNEGRTSIHFANEINGCVVLLHDFVHNGKAQSGSIGLGGEEGVENPRAYFLRNSDTGICNIYSQLGGLVRVGSFELGPDAYGSSLGHGFDGIEDNIYEYLVDQVWVEDDPWRILGEVYPYIDVVLRKIVGVTPKQYAAARRAQRFRNSQKTGQSVTDAIYDSGFGSSSRAYEKASDLLAMLPSTYRKGAAGLTIRFGVAPCFLGWVIVAATDRGICAIELGDDPKALPAKVQRSLPNALLQEAGPDFSDLIQKVIGFIEAPGEGIELPLDIQGTAFQQRVWLVLREVPPGVTVSYAQIADRIGSPRAVRAVSRACAANKLAVAVPCHRAVRSDGSLSGYRWGIERKRTLLLRESDNSEDLQEQHEKTDEI